MQAKHALVVVETSAVAFCIKSGQRPRSEGFERKTGHHGGHHQAVSKLTQRKVTFTARQPRREGPGNRSSDNTSAADRGLTSPDLLLLRYISLHGSAPFSVQCISIHDSASPTKVWMLL